MAALRKLQRFSVQVAERSCKIRLASCHCVNDERNRSGSSCLTEFFLVLSALADGLHRKLT